MAIKKIKTADLQAGMFVCKVEANSPGDGSNFSNFRVNSGAEVASLLESNITAVYVDTSRGMDVPLNVMPLSEAPMIMWKETFEVDLKDLRVGRETPVDLYWEGEKGELSLLCRSGLTYTEEVYELFKGGGVTSVRAPLNQKRRLELFKQTLEEEREKGEGVAGEYVDPRKIAEHVSFIASYHPISAIALIPGTKVIFDIFIKHGEGEVKLLSERGAVVDEDRRGRWIEDDLNILIRRSDMAAYQAYMMEHTKNSRDRQAKASFVRENSRIIIEGLAENPRSEKLMGETKESVKDLTRMVIDNPTSFYGLMKINNYDYYTFTHSVNVATLSLALAIAAGIRDKEDISELGLGCLLHDLGKAKVNSALINKPGKLSDSELKTVKNHVILGYDMLKSNKSVSERAFIPLLQHHEKLSGSGYPHGISGKDIHTFGRISAIIDIYDALTTERSYKKAFTPFDALSLISKNKNDYDTEIFSLFVRLVHDQEI